MPYNGAGTYSPPPPPVFPAVTGELIRAADYNAVIADLAAALTNCITKDDQTTVPLLTLVSLLVTSAAQLPAGSTVGGLPILTRRYTTGELVGSVDDTAPDGTVPLLGNTIGSASSGATARANADTQALFELLWNKSTNALLPIQDAAGGATTRGLSAASDFAANKRLPVPSLLDGEAPLARVSSTVMSKTVGEVITHAHTGTAASGGAHTHAIGIGTSEGDDPNTATNGGGRGTLMNTDSGGAHTHTLTIDATGGTKNKAAGGFYNYFIAL